MVTSEVIILELDNIKNLDLYIDKKIESENGIDVRRVPLEHDLDIGETAYFKNSLRNKIVKLDDEKYMFYRFDEIQTHIEPYYSDYTIDHIKGHITKYLDYNLDYAEDRVKLVERLINNNKWIYELVSSYNLIIKEQKKKTDFSAEEQKLNQALEFIASYICHVKFKNKDDEERFNKLKERQKHLHETKTTKKEDIELAKIEEKLANYHNHVNPTDISKSYKKGGIKKYNEKEKKIKNGDVFDPKETREIIRKRYTRKHKFDITFWDKMGYTLQQKIWRNEAINQCQEAVWKLEKLLGYDKNMNERKEIQHEFLKDLKTMKFIVDDREIIITPDRQLQVYNQSYANAKSNLKLAIETLTDPIAFKSMSHTSTVYNWNQDTYRYENDKEILISRNALNFADPKTYKGLLINYYDLADKYNEDMHDDMWAILRDFEDILKDTKLSKVEKIICKMLMKDKTVKEIGSEIRKKDQSFSNAKIYRYIDKIIPSKLKDTYMKNIDRWLYTEMIKGQWKKCSKCNEVKLISNDRYFRKRPDGKGDGFYNKCRLCESDEKVLKK